MQSVIDILEAAKALIKNPINWGKGDYVYRGDDTTKYCAIGAVMTVESDLADNALFVSERFLRDALPEDADRRLVRYNDAPERTHEEIMSLFDRAIELAKAEQP